MKIGIIGSSGGSALISALSCLRSANLSFEVFVVTDRSCGMETWAANEGIMHQRIDYSSADQFSYDALQFFQQHECVNVILFYTRRVTHPLISEIDVWNIHPALLPSFRGLHGVKDAIEAGVQIFGGTLHRVDDGLDTGPIQAQVASSIGEITTMPKAQRLSYLHKILLFLIWYEKIIGANKPGSKIYDSRSGFIMSSPGVSQPILDQSFKSFIQHVLPD